MTGEVTLRGAVTPVGGIKEKVLAAHRAGIERILLPARNAKDLRDVPEEVRSTLQIELVDTVEDVLRLALDLHVSPLHEVPAAAPVSTPATPTSGGPADAKGR